MKPSRKCYTKQGINGKEYNVMNLSKTPKRHNITAFFAALFFLFVVSNSTIAFSQQSSSNNKISLDSVAVLRNNIASSNNQKEQEIIPFPNPKKAGLYSAILPGAGQIYNNQYWKLGLIYGGAVTAAYFIGFNTEKYQTYRKAYIASLEGKPNDFTGIYSQSALKQLQDGYKKYLDMTYLLTGIGYSLQVIDAIVFAHLKNFDVTPDISMRLKVVNDPIGSGIGVVVNFAHKEKQILNRTQSTSSFCLNLR